MRILLMLALFGPLLLPVGRPGAHGPSVLAQDTAPLILAWSSADEHPGRSLAWGDVDGDGDLDLAVGNQGEANQLYRNDNGTLSLTAVWSAGQATATFSLAWGDVDNDGDPDLAVGNQGEPAQLYRNDNGQPGTTPVWVSDENDATHSVAWADVDNDGDLDLATGNDGANRLYRNTGGILSSSAVWSSNELDNTWSLAWGDIDNDGDLDLAAGNDGLNRLYLNQAGALNTGGVSWGDPDAETRSLAWGDIDNDGDLDLAAGNLIYPNQVYRNNGGSLAVLPLWSSLEVDGTLSVAWADYDNDGDLDLAAGNDGFEPLRLYRNDGGRLSEANVWSSSTIDAGWQVAWGDVDNDGDLDLAVANSNDPNRLYRNQGGVLIPGSAWAGPPDEGSMSVAWGDVDNDGDLDLAVANTRGEPATLYRNEQGRLTVTPVWSSTERDDSRSVAWGDIDDDGDLDLAVGNSFGVNRLYRNENGALNPTAVWSSTEADRTWSVAWGDVDGDGDLDLAAGNQLDPNRLYYNEGGMLAADAGWSSSETDFTRSVAWGDVDNDGDLDLAVANRPDLNNNTPDANPPNRLYRNDNGRLTESAAWSSKASQWSNSLAWGDVDGDGDLDLAAGNYNATNLLYRNENGTLSAEPVWISTEDDETEGIAWGDMDGDGDLDLAAANFSVVSGPNRVYRNEGGVLNSNGAWASTEIGTARSAAWGDVDGDGDLDLAIGSQDEANRLYRNLRNDGTTRVHIVPPAPAARANFYASARILRQGVVPISYILAHPRGTPVRAVRVFYSPNGGGRWLPATPAPGTVVTNLAAAPGGSNHTFNWQADADLIKSDNLVLRIEALGGYADHGPFQYGFSAAQSLSFRLETAPWFARVVDEQGQPLQGASVIAGGQLVTDSTGVPARSDRAGLVRLAALSPGQPLVALSAPLFEQPTSRAQHDGWAYRVYAGSLAWNNDGQPQVFTTAASGEQRLVVRRSSPLVLFNLVVSLEWAAAADELEQFARAFRNASAYLYDVSDGQLAFGQVLIADNARYWDAADIQFLTNNVTRPHAYVDGLTAGDTARVIRLGRAWDGNSGSQGSWDAPDGYRTIVHEFGHYAFGLYDSYFGYRRDGNGTLLGQYETSCTGPANRQAAGDAANATIMDYQYASSELAMRGVAGLWSESCETTAQWQINNESDWETLLRHFGDTQDPPRWRFTTPLERGAVLAGPAWPAELLPAWPDVRLQPGGLRGTLRNLTVRNPAGVPQRGVIVALYKQDRRVIGQGFTDGNGNLAIYGAEIGDILRVATMDGGYAASLELGAQTSLQIQLQPVGGGARLQSSGGTPHLRVIPQPAPDPGQVELAIVLQDFGPGADPQVLISAPGSEAGFAPTLSYSAQRGAYEGAISFSGGASGTGRLQAVGDGGGSLVRRASNYRLQRLSADCEQEIFSDDGNLWLQLTAGSIPGDEAYLAVMPPGALPGPLPEGLALVGDAYDISVSGALVQFERPALLRLHYDAAQIDAEAARLLVIYRWDPLNRTWQAQPGTAEVERQVVAAPISTLGIYALLGPAAPPAPQPRLLLPLVIGAAPSLGEN